MDISRTQAFYIYKSTKVVVIRQYKNFILTTLEVVALGFEGLKNG